MRHQTDILLVRNAQPDERRWDELRRFARAWNAAHAHRFEDVMGILLKIQFPDNTVAEFAELSRRLAALEAAQGIHVNSYTERVYEESDYGAGDFVKVFGVGLDGREGRPFVLNEAEVMRPGAPCVRCGWRDAFDCDQTGPFEIDEGLLEEPLEDGTPAPAGGWDFVHAPAGHKLVSRRLAGVLKENGVRGYALQRVVAGRGGRPSERVFQLSANRALVAPCPEHTRTVGGEFCPSCGAAYGKLEGDYYVSDAALGDDEIIACHRNLAAILYVSYRVYRLLVAAGLRQITARDVIKVCRHAGESRRD